MEDPMCERRICRLCLCATPALFDVFEENLREFCVNEAVKDLLQIEVENEFGLFWLLCLSCLEKLSNFHVFKLQCLQSNEAYRNRFGVTGRAQENDSPRKKRPGRVRKVSQSNNQASSSMNGEDSCGDVLMELASRDGICENMMHNSVTNLRVDLGNFDLVSELTKDSDWPESVQKELSHNGEDNFDIEEMVVPIKVENIEFEHDVWSGEYAANQEGSESQVNNTKAGGSVASNDEYLQLLDNRAELVHNNNYRTEEVDVKAQAQKKRNQAKLLTTEEQLQVIEEYLISNISLREIGDRYGIGYKSVQKLLKDREKILERWKKSRKIVDSSREKCVRDSQNHGDVNEETNRNVMDSSRKDCFSECQTQGVVDEETVLSNGSSESNLHRVLGTSGNEGDGTASFDCDICGKQFVRKHNLLYHLKCHGRKKAPKCKNCGLQFIDRMTLYRHDCQFLNQLHAVESGGEGSVGKHLLGIKPIESAIAIAVSKKPFECAVCGEVFTECDDLEEHVKLHMKNKEFVCDECGKAHNLKENLIAHLREVHGRSSAKQKRCGICGKKFLIKHFKVHQRVHSNEKRFECNECGRRFSERWHLMLHAKQHSNDGQYRCVFCPKSFTQSSRLKEHMLVHSGDKPYSCPTCGLCFSHSQSMKRHWLNHQDLKQHECKICHRRFFDVDKLKRHSQLHMKEEKQ